MKLRPEQQKLWRRIYLNAFEGGATTAESAEMADTAVKQWEERGAFDSPELFGNAEQLKTSKPITSWDRFSKNVSIMLNNDRPVDDIKTLFNEYPDELDFLQALVPFAEPKIYVFRGDPREALQRLCNNSLHDDIGVSVRLGKQEFGLFALTEQGAKLLADVHRDLVIPELRWLKS
jgi:hypothetical protein